MTVAIVMPVWNEAEGIGEFLRELNDALHGYAVEFVVVDDRSTDNTLQILHDLAASGFPVTVVQNDVNRGHGPSTMRALSAGLASGADVVVAIDGDGQFLGEDVREVVEALPPGSVGIVEGVRTSRDDPYFRKVVSLTTRLLVRLRCGKSPKDANTPLRAYSCETLRVILKVIPAGASTPNLFISTYARRNGIPVKEQAVRSIPRRGASETGSTWGKQRAFMPSKRFVKFCWGAAREWVTTPLPRDSGA